MWAKDSKSVAFLRETDSATKEVTVNYYRIADKKLFSLDYASKADSKNMEVFKKYRELAKLELKVIFGGRLAEYKYYDMHQVIASALKTVADL